jgi:hypothetical protein
MDTPKNEVTQWLVSACGVPYDKAASLSGKLRNECWISTLDALQQMLTSNASFLDVLACPKPMQLIINSKISTYNKKGLDKLSTREVEYLLNNLFPEELYGTKYRSCKISGLVLSVAESAEKLVKWGVSSVIHAEALWISLSKWKEGGVPVEQLAGFVEGALSASSDTVSEAGLDTSGVANDCFPLVLTQYIISVVFLLQERDQPSMSERLSKRRRITGSSGSSTAFNVDLVMFDDPGSADLVGEVTEHAKATASGEKKKVNRELLSLTQEVLPPPRPRAPIRPAQPPQSSLLKNLERPSDHGASERAIISKGSTSGSKRPHETTMTKATVPRKGASSVESPSQTSGGGEASSVSLNARVKKWYSMLCSGDREAQSAALKALSKQAADRTYLSTLPINPALLRLNFLVLLQTPTRWVSSAMWGQWTR